MRKLWLLFAQSAAITLGILLSIGVIHPEWLQRFTADDEKSPVVTINQVGNVRAARPGQSQSALAARRNKRCRRW